VEDLSAVDRVIALAGRISVEGYSRKTKSGKTVQVDAYTRSPGDMSNQELYDEVQSLSGKVDPQSSNRRVALHTEIRVRRQQGKWSTAPAEAPASPKAKEEGAATIKGMSNDDLWDEFNSSKGVDEARHKEVSNELRRRLRVGDMSADERGQQTPEATPPPAAAEKPAETAPAAPAAPAAGGTPSEMTHSDIGVEDKSGENYEPLKSAALDAVMKGHNVKGTGMGKGTPEDPVNAGGNVMLAAKALSEGKSIRLNHVDEVGTLLDKLSEMVEEAKAKGEAAPTFDLCKVSVPKTNLFCAEGKGIPRAKMPQLGGIPKDGSRAAELPRSDRGEVNIEGAFRKELEARGIKVEAKTVPAAFLKASQSELDGPKVAGMSKAMEAGKVPDAPIFVTRDGYIIDGHHRWASKVAIDAKDGKLGDVTMPVEMIDMEIGEALDFSNAFALDFGIQPKGLGAAAEGVGQGNKPADKTTARAMDAKEKVAALSAVDRLIALSGGKR
jgi:hypothetical protein